MHTVRFVALFTKQMESFDSGTCALHRRGAKRQAQPLGAAVPTVAGRPCCCTRLTLAHAQKKSGSFLSFFFHLLRVAVEVQPPRSGKVWKAMREK